jgi:hypothetical protein
LLAAINKSVFCLFIAIAASLGEPALAGNPVLRGGWADGISIYSLLKKYYSNIKIIKSITT